MRWLTSPGEGPFVLSACGYDWYFSKRTHLFENLMIFPVTTDVLLEVRYWRINVSRRAVGLADLEHRYGFFRGIHKAFCIAGC